MDINNLKALHHKPGVNSSDWDKVHPNLITLALFTYDYCNEHQLPLTITSIIRPKIPGVSLTDIHAKGRAFDISVMGWSHYDIENFIKVINESFHIGAISLKDGTEHEAIYEDGITRGKGPHLHVQCAPTSVKMTIKA